MAALSYLQVVIEVMLPHLVRGNGAHTGRGFGGQQELPADTFIKQLVVSGTWQRMKGQLGVLASMCKTNVHNGLLTSFAYLRKCVSELLGRHYSSSAQFACNNCAVCVCMCVTYCTVAVAAWQHVQVGNCDILLEV